MARGVARGRSEIEFSYGSLAPTKQKESRVYKILINIKATGGGAVPRTLNLSLYLNNAVGNRASMVGKFRANPSLIHMSFNDWRGQDGHPALDARGC